MDTIAAISTAPGRSAVALVRVSGPEVTRIITRLAGEFELEPRRGVLRTIRDPSSGAAVDRVLLTYFAAPDSYTGEDVLELSGHGGLVVPALLLDAVLSAGAREAEPGEFTRRAYLAGKLDLVQVEATLDLIEATSGRMRDAALFALEKGLSRRVELLRRSCLELQALLAYDIDFPEEDDGPLDRETIAAKALELASSIESMAGTADTGMLLREGALAVIAGRPNVGKSTLFNALLGVERAIVTSEPGTTRDAIEVPWTAGGYPFRLVDTAGVRSGADRAEAKGIDFARSFVARADVVLFCAEAGRDLSEAERSLLAEIEVSQPRTRLIMVRTKADLAATAAAEPDAERVDTKWPEVDVSSTSGSGLRNLINLLTTTTYGIVDTTRPVVMRRRQLRALQSAAEGVGSFVEAWEDQAPPEIAATHLQDAAMALEDVLGVVTTEDVLDTLFSEFCVGK